MRSSCVGLFGLILLAGCGDAKPQPVKGKVTLFNQPLGNVTVQFLPIEGQDKSIVGATGVTNEAGEYSLKSDNGREGAKPGKYKVVVFDHQTDDDDATVGKALPKAKPKRVPPLYGDSATTPLTITVEPNKQDYPITIQ